MTQATDSMANQKPGERHTSLAARIDVLLCICLLGSACSDGYPTIDVPVLAPGEMTQAQRLREMNQIGRLAYFDTRWRYTLNDVCDLKVTTGAWFDKKSTSIALQGGQIVRNIDHEDKTYDIHLKQIESSVRGVIPLLETANWADSVSFYTLVNHVRRDCIQEASA